MLTGRQPGLAEGIGNGTVQGTGSAVPPIEVAGGPALRPAQKVSGRARERQTDSAGVI